MVTTALSLVRLALVVDASTYGGAEFYVTQLMRHLPPRFRTSLIGTDPIPHHLSGAAEDAGVPVRIVPSVRGKFDIRGNARMVGVLRHGHPHVVHVNMAAVTNNRHALVTAWAARRPVVATLHIRNEIPPGLHRSLLGLAYGRLARFIAVSSDVATQLVHELHIPEQRVTVVPNGVAVTQETDRGRTHRPLRVGTLGRLTAQKGLDILIACLRQLRDEGHDVELVIAGEGPDRGALETLAAGLPVRLVGFVDDVQPFLESLDLFCLPSRAEALPFALLEAMMCGLPCVVTRVGDMADAVGDAGVVVPPNNAGLLARAIGGLLSSPTQRKELGRLGRLRAVDHYSVEAMVHATTRVYDEAIAG